MLAIQGFLFLLDVVKTGQGDQVLDDVMPQVVYVVSFVLFWSAAVVLLAAGVLALRRRQGPPR